MATTSTWREPGPEPTRDPPREARCRDCGEWMVTVPAGTRWARGRCGNRRCRRHGQGQTVKLDPR